MATKWSQVIQKPEFLALSPEDQEETRQLYFEDVVVPQVSTEDLEMARQVFDEDTRLTPPNILATEPAKTPEFGPSIAGAVPVIGPALSMMGEAIGTGVAGGAAGLQAIPAATTAAGAAYGQKFIGEDADPAAAYQAQATTPGRMLAWAHAKMQEYLQGTTVPEALEETRRESQARVRELMPEELKGRTFRENISDPETALTTATWGVASNLGPTGVALAAGLAGGAAAGPLGAIGAAGSTAYALESGQSYTELKEMGVSEDDAQITSSVVGAINAALEIAPIGLALKNVPVVNRLIKREITQAMVRDPTLVLKVAAADGGTEGIQQVVGNAGKKVYDENQELFEGVDEATFIGTLTGGLVGGGATLITPKRTVEDVQVEAAEVKGELAADLDSTIPDPQRIIAQGEIKTVAERQDDLRSEAAAQVDSLEFELEEQAPAPIQTEVVVEPEVEEIVAAPAPALEVELPVTKTAEDQVLATATVKAAVKQRLAQGELNEGDAYRGVDPDELRQIAETGKLTVGKDAEGVSGISAVPLSKDPEVPFPVYGASGVGYVVPAGRTADSGRALEVLVDENTDPTELTYMIGDQALTFEELQETFGIRPTQPEVEEIEETGAVAPGAEFTLPTDLASRAIPVEAPEAPVTDVEPEPVQRPSEKELVRPQPTSPRLARKYKELGGKRDKETGEWTFRTVDRKRLERAEQVFGESDVVAAPDVVSSFKDYVAARGLAGQKLDRNEMKAIRSDYRTSLQNQRGKVDTTPGDLSVTDTHIDRLRYHLQDKFLGLKRIEEKGRKTTEVGPYQAEELYHGRAGARVENIERDYVDPVTSILSEHKIKVQDLNDYMLALHAEEANAELQRRNPDLENNESLSGMPNDDAVKIQEKWENHEGMQQAAQFIRDMNDATADIIESEGLEPGDVVQAWRDTYQNYVPTHREGKETEASKGKGFSIRGREAKGRVGSERKVVDVIAHSVMNHARAIVRAEKNRVGRTLLEFARANPDPNFWAVDPVETVKRFDPETGLVTTAPDPSYQTADNVFMVKEDGETHHITFNQNNPVAIKLASSMKNLDADQIGVVMNTLQKVNRFLSAMSTTYNPVFIFSNFVRDLQTAAIKLEATEAEGLQLQIIRDIPKAMKGLWTEDRGKGKGPWAQYAKEFRMEGGKTGWIDATTDVETQVKRLESKINAKGGTYRHRAVGTLKAAGRVIEDVNSVVENGVRLSAYVNARKQGMTKENAASLSKNLTVNFNRKGSAGPAFNAAYLFFNAGVQGSANVLGSMKSKRVRRLAAGLIVSAVGMALGNRELGGEDEDGIPYYDKIGHWEKERNLIIMNPASDEGDYFKIPLPYGYNIFKVMGDQIAEAISREDYNPLESAAQVASAVSGSFNPVGSDASWLQFIAPTVADPIAQIYENQTFYGSPLRPENRYGADKADAELYFKSARDTSVSVAKALNELTGGHKYKSGAVDVSPETIDLWVDFLAGGAGRTAADVTGTVLDMAAGEERHTRRIPFLNRFYSAESDTWTPRTYFEYKADIDAYSAIVKDARKARDKEAFADLKDDPRRLLIPMLRAAESRLRSAYKRRDKLEAAQPEGWKEDVKKVEERIEKTRKRIIVKYREAIHGIE